MKKFLSIFVSLLFIVLVSGCSGKKTITCTKESIDSENYKTVDTMKITYNSEKVLKVNDTIVTDTSVEYADYALNIMDFFKSAFDEVDGISANIDKIGNDKIKTEIEIIYDKIDIDDLKEKLGSIADGNNFYTSINYTIDEFKEAHLEGYTCK